MFSIKNSFYELIVKVPKKFYKKMFKIWFQNRFFARWQAILSIFYFEIEFIKGSSNVLPDFLSCEFLQGK